MANSADPDKLAKPTDLDLHCLQWQGIYGFRRTRVKIKINKTKAIIFSNGKIDTKSFKFMIYNL